MSINRDNMNRLPGIGMRIVKSAIAVAICFIIDYFRGEQGMVFYSQLAALWCIQMYRANTKQNAIQRTIGTIVGALYGLLYLIMSPLVLSDEIVHMIIGDIIVSIMIIIILYTTVLLKKPQASYFSCVVFLSIVINHVKDSNPFFFVWNRFLDTMIGIVVGIVVNDFRICLHPNRETLFISGLDEVLLDKKEMLSQFSKVELNRMIDDGLNFTIATMRTPASIIDAVRDVHLRIPVIAMNGACLYDMETCSYLKVYVISHDESKSIISMIKEAGICFYTNVIIDDMLVIYYEDVEDEVNRQLVKKLRTSPYRNYVKRPLPDGESVVYFMLLDLKSKIADFYRVLKERGILNKFNVVTYDSKDYEGYSYIKIYSKNATKENMIDYLKEYSSLHNVVTFGSVQNIYDVYIDSKNANRLVREVRKRYEPIFEK
ncbi:MAG: HAD hydrolase family protein [Lachnospiraceae bacterium]|nr:HAD hydrolase family protein [Lachnospiraceae bacterium]